MDEGPLGSEGTAAVHVAATTASGLRDRLRATTAPIRSACDVLQEQLRPTLPADLHPDLDRIIAATRALLRLIEGVEEPSPEDEETAHAARRKIAHDLRNPVSVMAGYAELLAEELAELPDDFDVDLEGFAEMVRAFGARIDQVVDDGKAPAPVSASPALKAAEDSPSRYLVEKRPTTAGNILVVDDVEAARDPIARQLRQEGHQVTTAADGIEALALMQDWDFDVVLLALTMPGIDGFEVLTRMRADSRLRDVGVLMISGADEESNAIRCIQAGAEDYLSKPVNSVLLRARINATLARKRWHDHERLYRRHLESEKEKSDALLLNILPRKVIDRLSTEKGGIADAFEQASILFSDFVGFTEMCHSVQPRVLVDNLNRIFSEFDALALDLGVEKIKTLGDGYMAVTGIPDKRSDHAEVIADMALGMIDILARLNPTLVMPLRMRIGINSGPVVAGVIGTHKFAYDLWGDTVNIASRHESYSEPDCIHVSKATAGLLKKGFKLRSRGTMHIRGHGEVETFYLLGRQAAAAGRPTESLGAGPAVLSILVADDDAAMRQFIVRGLARQGWTVDAVPDGRAGWEAVRQKDYDLLLTDCDMPEVDGFELAKRIRARERQGGRRLPIVALTASTSVEGGRRCLDAGMDAYINKPVMWPEVIAWVRRLTGAASA